MTNAPKIIFSDSPYPIYEGKYWNVILHRDNQAYLGRCIIYLKSRLTDDLLSLTKDERTELWGYIMPRLVAALKEAFQPDRINYSHLANTVNHVHWHIIPRYEKNPERVFAGVTFSDERVGVHYAPVPEKEVSKTIMKKIYITLKKSFHKNPLNHEIFK